jgi:LCP family protein required for cell wall assembly
MSPQFGRRRLLDPRGEIANYDHAQRRSRIIGRILVGFFAVVVLASAIGITTVKNILDKVHHEPKLSSLIDNRPPKESPGPGSAGQGGTTQNILILGVDSRLGENSSYQPTVGPAQTETLSDTAILAHLSGDGKHITLVSIPRDSVVQIPACRKVDNNGSGISDSSGQPVMTKPTKALFNEAIQLGGPACTVKTLESLTNVYIDHYLEIDFEGVVKMSTALGGVPLTMCQAIHDAHTGLNLPKGPVNLKGQTALEFVRARYGLTGGDDLHRIQRQQQFMAAMVRKALASSTLFNLPSMTSFYGDVASSLTTDMGSSALINLALHYRHIDTNNVVFATVPTYNAPKGDAFYQHLYWSLDQANALFTDLRDDRPLSTTTTTAGQNVATLTVAPSLVSVRVLNGTTTNNLAHQVADSLAAEGFRIAGIGGATQVPTAKTTISFQASRSNSAQTLAAALKVSHEQVVDASAQSTITLTIGQDWAGLAPPSESATPSSASSASGAPSAPAASGSAVPGVKTTTASTDTCVEG